MAPLYQIPLFIHLEEKRNSTVKLSKNLKNHLYVTHSFLRNETDQTKNNIYLPLTYHGAFNEKVKKFSEYNYGISTASCFSNSSELSRETKLIGCRKTEGGGRREGRERGF